MNKRLLLLLAAVFVLSTGWTLCLLPTGVAIDQHTGAPEKRATDAGSGWHRLYAAYDVDDSGQIAGFGSPSDKFADSF